MTADHTWEATWFGLLIKTRRALAQASDEGSVLLLKAWGIGSLPFGAHPRVIFVFYAGTEPGKAFSKSGNLFDGTACSKSSRLVDSWQCQAPLRPLAELGLTVFVRD